MKANPEKIHLLLSSKTPKKAYFGGALVESSSTEKLLGIKIDSDLTFDEHISSICNKVAKKINVLSRLVNYMSLDKRRMVMKAFIESQFNYCPLIWMFHLAIEIYNFLHNLSPCIMINILKVNQTVPYDLRKRNALQSEIPVL